MTRPERRTPRLLRLLLTVVLLLIGTSRPAAAQAIRENLPHWCQDFWMLTRKEILQCLERDYAVADAELNRVYRATMARLPSNRRVQLREEQRSWLRRYDAVLTEFYSRPWANHSRVKVLPSQIQAVRDRTAYLRTYGQG